MGDALKLIGPRGKPGDRRVAPLELCGPSVAARRLADQLRRVADEERGVLFVAERGAEVEPLARDAHDRSSRAGQPFVVVACAEAGVNLERQLFGMGVMAGAADLEAVAAVSRLATAAGGTAFLQDVTELSSSAQARLARVVRDGEVLVDGRARPVRVMASALREIDADVVAYRFRDDLYRRLNTTRVDVPALRDRRDDIPAMATRVMADLCDASGLPPRPFTAAAMALLTAISWRGNLAELQAVMWRVVADTRGDAVRIEDLLTSMQLDGSVPVIPPTIQLREARLRFERDYIAAVLQHHGWRVGEAAQTLGIQRPNLYRKARQLGIPLAKSE